MLEPRPPKVFDLAKTGEAPIAAEAVRRIDELFAIERTINGKASEQRLAVRREKSTPLVIDLEIWMRQQRALLSEGKGHTFESCRVRHVFNHLDRLSLASICAGNHMATNYPRLGRGAFVAASFVSLAPFAKVIPRGYVEQPTGAIPALFGGPVSRRGAR